MRTTFKFLLPTLAASLLLAACGSSSSTSSTGSAATQGAPAASTSAASGSSVLVKTASNSKLGTTVLVDARGMTLYHLSVEQHGKFICTAACTKIWPPLTVASGSKPSGSVGSLGTIKRPGGGLQVTYKGQPLYTFAHDTSAGQANGQGVKDVGTWTAVTSSAKSSSAPAPAPTTTTSSSSSGGGYAY
jgi:predicted lipoprotein with Yx(FWY)xxD motif